MKNRKKRKLPSLLPPAWPPLIRSRDLPFWVRARDMILTLSAWLMMGYLLRGVALTLIEWARNEPVQFMSKYFLTLHAFWLQLRPYAHFVIFLILWLGFWTFRRRKTLTGTQKFEIQPPELDLETQARDRNVPPELLIKWREEKMVRIDFDKQGKLLVK